MPTEYSQKQLNRIARIDQAIRELFDAYPVINDVVAKKLMPVSIQKGIFIKTGGMAYPLKTCLAARIKKTNYRCYRTHVPSGTPLAGNGFQQDLNWNIAPFASELYAQRATRKRTCP